MITSHLGELAICHFLKIIILKIFLNKHYNNNNMQNLNITNLYLSEMWCTVRDLYQRGQWVGKLLAF